MATTPQDSGAKSMIGEIVAETRGATMKFVEPATNGAHQAEGVQASSTTATRARGRKSGPLSRKLVVLLAAVFLSTFLMALNGSIIATVRKTTRMKENSADQTSRLYLKSHLTSCHSMTLAGMGLHTLCPRRQPRPPQKSSRATDPDAAALFNR
jgi:hypothetical protein